MSVEPLHLGVFRPPEHRFRFAEIQTQSFPRPQDLSMSESSLETDAPVCCEECVQEFPALGPKFLSSGLDHGGRECGICLGILPRFPKIARAVQEHLLKSGYRHRKFRLHLSLPPDVSLRHEAQTLSQTSSSSAPVHAFPPVGLKQRVRRKLADWLKKELMMSYDDKVCILRSVAVPDTVFPERLFEVHFLSYNTVPWILCLTFRVNSNWISRSITSAQDPKRKT